MLQGYGTAVFTDGSKTEYQAEALTILEAYRWLGHDLNTEHNITILTETQTAIKASTLVGKCRNMLNSLSGTLKFNRLWVSGFRNERSADWSSGTLLLAVTRWAQSLSRRRLSRLSMKEYCILLKAFPRQIVLGQGKENVVNVATPTLVSTSLNTK